VAWYIASKRVSNDFLNQFLPRHFLIWIFSYILLSLR
jgi:hypothetical protein